MLNGDPDRQLAALFPIRGREAAAAAGMPDLMRVLRRMKADAALLIALADIAGVWPLSRITGALTSVAETAVGAAVRYLLADAAGRGQLVPADPENPEAGSGYIVLAMGKMGGGELNYSSDIDLIVFFDPAVAVVHEHVDAGSLFARITRDSVKILQQRTADGYVFRTDLRLRPDPASTAIAISVEAALNYYESRGQNWERAALIKARPCAGDLDAGRACLADCRPSSGANISITPRSPTSTP